MDYSFPKGPFLEPETFKFFSVFIVNNYPPFTNGWRELFSLKNTNWLERGWNNRKRNEQEIDDTAEGPCSRTIRKNLELFGWGNALPSPLPQDRDSNSSVTSGYDFPFSSIFFNYLQKEKKMSSFFFHVKNTESFPKL